MEPFMKTLLALTLMLAPALTLMLAPAFALASPASETERLSESAGQYVEMLAQNPAAFRKFVALHRQGPRIMNLKITHPSDDAVYQGLEHAVPFQNTYVLETEDCLHTDQCRAGYRWVVTETVTSSGYSSESRFKHHFYRLP
jgi:hypothetical protein